MVASTSDVFSGIWNPAKLVEVDTAWAQIGYMHVFDGLYNYDVAGISFPSSRQHAMSVSAVRYGVDDIINSLDFVDENGTPRPENLTLFSVADYAAFVTYSRRHRRKRIQYGGSVKVIHRSAGEFAKAWGAGMDFGFCYYSRSTNFQLGAILKNAFGTYTAWNFTFTDKQVTELLETGNEIPGDGSVEATTPTLVLGGQYRFPIGRVTLSPELNIDVTFDGRRNVLVSADPVSADPHIGLEVGYYDALFFRGGIYNVQEITGKDDIESGKQWTVQPSVGAGVKMPGFELDYALTQFDFREELTHLLTLKLGFLKPEKDK